MNIAFDTNILLYYEGVNGPEKQREIQRLLDALDPTVTCLPMQAAAELLRALVTKFRWDRKRAYVTLQHWQDATRTRPLTVDGFADALALSTLHELQIFDAMILSSAVEMGCSVLLSEDMLHGYVWRGCTVVNPFIQPYHPTLSSMIPTI